MGKFTRKTVGLFGTCGQSKWREPFIKMLDEMEVSWYNPCRDDWDPEEDSWQLAEDRIILMPVTSETYGTGTLAESNLGITAVCTSIFNKSRKLVVYVAPEVMLDESNPALDSAVAVKESNRARKIILEHLKLFHNLPNVYQVDSLELMLEVTKKLVKLVELEDELKAMTSK